MSAAKIVHLPTAAEVEAAKASSRMLSKYAAADDVQISLCGRNGKADQLVLPDQALQILLEVLSEMSKGNAISLIPHHHEISTQEAANLLNVSRPYLVQLLEKGELPFRLVGTHRCVRLTNLMEYKANIDKQRSRALDELAALSQESNIGY
ncbi:MAG: helix-turn-helix domain-containing protein [Gammaproteobacteria bacterium]|nr:helix-turn-helix domain-containing protein [Gammaproteobacteria bacterium]